MSRCYTLPINCNRSEAIASTHIPTDINRIAEYFIVFLLRNDDVCPWVVMSLLQLCVSSLHPDWLSRSIIAFMMCVLSRRKSRRAQTGCALYVSLLSDGAYVTMWERRIEVIEEVERLVAITSSRQDYWLFVWTHIIRLRGNPKKTGPIVTC